MEGERPAKKIKLEDPETTPDDPVSNKNGIQDYFDNFDTEINESVDKAAILETGSYFAIADEEGVSNSVTLVHGDETSNKASITTEDGVSYVYIVQQNETDKDDGSQNMAIYDFNEHDEGGGQRVVVKEPEIVEDETVDEKSVIQKAATAAAAVKQAKNQVVSSVTHMCPYCNYTSNKKYLLSRHMKSHSEERPHKCSVCERGFKTVASLQNHVNTHTGRKPHLCKFCTSAFTTSGELVRHVRYRHTLEKPHKCTECDYASVELSKLKRHFRCHTGERPYQCPHCTYASPDTFKLKRHLRIHTGEKPYQCDVCSARFTQSNSLKAHKLTHEGVKPVFKCDLCPTTCGRKTDLRIHVQKLHTSDVPIKCKRCDETFPDRWNMKQHIRVHGGDRAYKCVYCLYSATTPRALENHILTHSSERPFQCDICKITFKQKALLKRHENTCHNPDYVPNQRKYKCPHCIKCFVQPNSLQKHVSEMHESGSGSEMADRVKCEAVDDVSSIDCKDIDQDNALSDEDNFVLTDNGQQIILLEVIPKEENDIPKSASSTNTNISNLRDHTLLNNTQLMLKNNCGFDENDEMEYINGNSNGDGNGNGNGVDDYDDDGDVDNSDQLICVSNSNLSGVQKFDNLSSTIRIETDSADIEKDVESCFGFDIDD